MRGCEIEAVCIKSYKDEDDLYQHEQGDLNSDDIKVYKVGDIGTVLDGLYNSEYWEPVNEEKP